MLKLRSSDRVTQASSQSCSTSVFARFHTSATFHHVCIKRSNTNGTLPTSCHSMPFHTIHIMLLTVCITFLRVPLERGETRRETPQCDLGITHTKLVEDVLPDAGIEVDHINSNHKKGTYQQIPEIFWK